METIRILLVDDQDMVREGLRSMLQQEMDMEVVGEAANVEEALAYMDLLSPDVILMDVKIPRMGGIEGTRKLKEKHPSCNVIILTWCEDYLTQASKAGAVGFLTKQIKREELAMAIRAVHVCDVALFHDGSPSISKKFVTNCQTNFVSFSPFHCPD